MSASANLIPRPAAEDRTAFEPASPEGFGDRSPSPGRKSALQLGFFLLKALVSAAVIAVLVARVSFDRVGEMVANAAIVPLLLAVILLIAQFPLAGWRWKLVLRGLGYGADPWKLQNLVWLGQFANQLMPSFVAGDALRGWYLCKSGVPTRVAVSSLLVDRVVGMLGLFILVVLMAVPILNVLGNSIGWPIIATAVGGVGAVVVGVGVARFLVRMPLAANFSIIQKLSADAWRVSTAYAGMALILALAVATNVLAGLAVYFLARSLGISLAAVDAVALVPVALFAMLLPISIAGWGVREGVLVFLLGFVAIPADEALILSLCFGTVMTAVALPGGLIWIRLR